MIEQYNVSAMYDARITAFAAIAIGALTIITMCAVAKNMGTMTVSNRITVLQLAPLSKVRGEAQ